MHQTKNIGLTKRIDESQQITDAACHDLVSSYDDLLSENRLGWSANLRLEHCLGSGGHGTVYLAKRIGADDFSVPVAVKIFSPERYQSVEEYDTDMARIGRISALVARIQHENLLAVDHFLDRDRIRIMVMEWIEGFDLRRLLTARMYGATKTRVSRKRWLELNEQVVTAGTQQPRLRIGAATTILRDCLKGLAALHREGIVHGDIKPANVMLKKTGSAKIIDIGSAHDCDCSLPVNSCTPVYTAPNVLEGENQSTASDLISLAYLTIELLSGRPLFAADSNLEDLIRQKRSLPQRLDELLPEEVTAYEPMIELLQELLKAQPDNLRDSAERFLEELHSHPQRIDQTANLQCWVEEIVDCEILSS